MDNQAAVDTALEHELFYNERIVTHPILGRIRLARPTLEQDKFIAEERRRQFQRDLRDPDIMSKDQLEKLAIERGMWAADMDKRIEDLTARTGEAMGLLDSLGFKDFDTVLGQYREKVDEIVACFPDPEDITEPNTARELREAVAKYFALTDERPTFKERAYITDNATSSAVEELMDEAEVLRTQLDLLKQMAEVTRELQDLQRKRTRIFMDSVESRADRTEQLATVYYGCSKADTGERLWPTFDDMRRAKIDEVDFVLTEYHMFTNGVTDEFRATLAKYGFHQRLGDTIGSSDDSPAQPSTNSDGESVENVPTSSSPASA